MKTKIAILGLGWLGVPLANKLKEQGYDIFGTTRTLERLEHLNKGNLIVVQLDLIQLNYSLPLVISDSDICILCIPPGKLTDVKDYGNNLNKIVNQFSTSTKFIFISSTSVYPDTKIIAREEEYTWKENQDCNPIANAELKLHEALKDKLTILRMAGLIGPKRHPAKFFDGRTNIENGLSPVNLIHLIDSIQLIELIIKKNYWGEIINGCSSIHPTREEYYSFACKKFNFKQPTFLANGSGKLVDNSKSIKLGMNYHMDNPFEYWEVEKLNKYD